MSSRPEDQISPEARIHRNEQEAGQLAAAGRKLPWSTPTITTFRVTDTQASTSVGDDFLNNLSGTF